jgi:pimeloyl-ACP methyl ester carboxylesterase/DNA-binding winged helix-turn-helix (wHTH) protein
MTLASGGVYEFGPFRLDVGERRLVRDGDAVTLRGKVFDTLCVLVEHAGRLLTKTELMQAVWPDANVEENNLNHNISVLRRALGEHATGQQYVETVPRVGYRFVAPVTGGADGQARPRPAPPAAPAQSLRQEIRFATTSDGVRIAYSSVGSGVPLVKAANWLNHLEYEWESPVWRHWVHEIASHRRLVRYDERGCGLSDWQVPEQSFESWVRDLETIVDALDLEPFDLLGISQGGPVAVTYAVRHPERVRRLVLFGTYARGWRHRNDPRTLEAREAITKLVRLGWGQNNPAFRQIFATRFIPDGGPAEMDWFNDLQRVSVSPENAARFMDDFAQIDVRSILRDIRTPTLVLHCQGDAVVPFDEGRLLAAGIPGARFVPLPSRNHLLLDSEPAWRTLVEGAVRAAPEPEPPVARLGTRLADPPRGAGEVSRVGPVKRQRPAGLASDGPSTSLVVRAFRPAARYVATGLKARRLLR